MKTIEVKTSELIGAALDWAVGYAIAGRNWSCDHGLAEWLPDWNPSTDWSQAGPMIEKYKLHLHCDEPSASFLQSGMRIGYTANTVLIAAMRAIVAAKLGDVVSVPVELVGF